MELVMALPDLGRSAIHQQRDIRARGGCGEMIDRYDRTQLATESLIEEGPR
jgi:hypothetical protein